jgi:hypothetical protein
MRNVVRVAAVTLLVASLSLAPSIASAQAEVLTNESITQMIAAKVSKDLITSKIRTTKATYDVSTAGLISLYTSKVPNDIIKLMMTQAATVPGSKETLSNDGVIRMVNGQLSRDIIVAKIQMSKPDYDLTTNGMINLTQNKVSQDIVKAMMTASSSTPAGKP